MAVRSRSSDAKINHMFTDSSQVNTHQQRMVRVTPGISCLHGDGPISFTELWENLSGGDEMYDLCNPFRHGVRIRL